MQNNKENLKNFSFVEKNKPSRFVIDLKNIHHSEENRDDNVFSVGFLARFKNKNNDFLYFFNLKKYFFNIFFSKSKKRVSIFKRKTITPSLNFKFKIDFFNNPPKAEQHFSYIFSSIRSVFKSFATWQEKTSQILGHLKEKRQNVFFLRLDKLAFFGIIRISLLFLTAIFNFIYKIFYYLGWLFLFVLRFVYFFFQKIFLFLGHEFSLLGKAFAIMRNFIGFILFIFLYPFGLLLKILIGFIAFIFGSLKIIFNFFRNLFLSFFKKLCYPVGKVRKAVFKKRKLGIKKYLPAMPVWNVGKIFGKLNIPTPLIIRQKKSFSFSFVIFLFIISIPFIALSYYKTLTLTENSVLGVAEAAVSDLQGAVDSFSGLDFSAAKNNFSEASQNFLRAEEELKEVNKALFALASLSENKKLRLASQAEQVVSAGQAAANLGKNISAALDSFLAISDKDILEKIEDFIYYGHLAQIESENLNKLLAEIDFEILPKEYQAQFLFLRDKVSYFSLGLSEFLSIAENLNNFLGASENKRYLLIFQNNTELRATGGFIGSYALVDFKKGKINNLEVPAGGGYDTEGGLMERIISPQPLHLIQPLWHFWDANWSPDWPTSAEKIMWFYEKSGGPTVDGVISFTPTVLEKFLEIMGSVDMSEEYGVVIDHENFWLTIQDIVENKATSTADYLVEENKPKKIIGDMMEKIIYEMPSRLDRDKLVKIFGAIEDSLAEKHILFYFVDEELQKIVDDKNWSGRIKSTDSNYLAVINTNIAGGKSDKKIKEQIIHRAEINSTGEIINTLQIKRTHTGTKGEPFSGVRNVDWMRIYVPWGSQLLEARGFTAPDSIYFKETDPSWREDEDLMKTQATERIHEDSGTLVYDELGKTVFANWSMVDPGESVVIYLKYKMLLPIQSREDSWLDSLQNLFDSSRNRLYPYSLYIQKQAGSLPSEIKTSLSIAGDYDLIWKYPADLNVNLSGWLWQGDLDQDKYQAILLSK